ncbi:acylphosphatase [Candidatus Micrarchaeota archaeon]|nr:acylphosphatase [Candidatus Micrarchaeota archaeon]
MVKKGTLAVEGNIQGVGYRAYVKKVAVSLGIRGAVRNLSDGNVEIRFEAPSEGAYKAFYGRIWSKRGREEDEFSLHVTKITPLELREIPEKEREFHGLFEVDYGTPLTPYEKENLERQEIAILVLSDFSSRTNQNFGVMEQKYGKISTTLEELKTGLLKELAEGIEVLSHKK